VIRAFQGVIRAFQEVIRAFQGVIRAFFEASRHKGNEALRHKV
jgi:hypothetical protein